MTDENNPYADEGAPSPDAESSATDDVQVGAAVNESPDIVMCVLSYLGIFALIPYLVKKEDPFLQFHSKQGLVLTAVAIFFMVISGLLSIIPFVVCLMMPLSFVVSIGFLVLAIVGIIKACSGERWVMPVLGQFTDKIPDAT